MEKVKKGPYIKSSNNSNKIIYNILISMIPFIIYRFYLTKMEDIVLLIISVSFTLLTSIIYEIISNIKDYKFDFHNHIYSLIMSIIVYLFIPYNTPLIVLAISNIISTIINKIYKNINSVLISGLMINLYFIIKSMNPLYLNMNIIMLVIILLASLSYLIITKSVKFRISVVFLLVSILIIFIKDFLVSNIYTTAILGIYIVSELYSSPKGAYSGYIYSFISAILYIILPLPYFIVYLILTNIINKYLDLNVAYYLASK